MFPLQSKNLRRLNQTRWIVYLALALIAFVAMGIGLLKQH